MMNFEFSLEICHGENLAKHSIFSPPNPYIKIAISTDTKNPSCSKVIPKTQNPKWNETFKLTINSKEDTIKISVWDSKKPDRGLTRFFSSKKENEAFLGQAILSYQIIEKFLNQGPMVLNLEKIPDQDCPKISGYIVLNLTKEAIVEEVPRQINEIIERKPNNPAISVEEWNELNISDESHLDTNDTMDSFDANLAMGRRLSISQDDFLETSKNLLGLPFAFGQTSTPLQTTRMGISKTKSNPLSSYKCDANSSEVSSGIGSMNCSRVSTPFNEKELLNKLETKKQSKFSTPSLTPQTSHNSLSEYFNMNESKLKSNLKVPSFKKFNKYVNKSKSSLKASFNHNLTTTDESDMGDNVYSSNSSLAKSSESIYESFKLEELNSLAFKYKKFRYDLINYGSKIVVFKIEMSRNSVLEDSFCFLTKLKSKYSRTQFLIKFREEEGVDYGGVGKEWFHLLSSEIFRPSYGLFELNSQNNQLEINKHATSLLPTEFENMYKFIGQMLGLALYNSFHVDVSLGNIIFKYLLDEPVGLEDLKFIDFEMYNSLNWILNNDITDTDLLYTFSTSYVFMGQIYTVDLVENGRNINVEESNKKEFVRCFVNWRLNTSIKKQIDEIIKGFFQIVPKSLVKIFNSEDLQLIICGLETIENITLICCFAERMRLSGIERNKENIYEVSKWKLNTSYKNCTEYTQQVIWFWRAVRTLDNNKRLRLLQLTTGSSRLPIKQFSEFDDENSSPFTICLLPRHRDTNSLPTISTCFNRIGLPYYESYEKLLSKLVLTIDETRDFSVQ